MCRILVALLCLVALGCRSSTEPETSLQVSDTDSVTVIDVRFHSSAIAGVVWYRIVTPKVSPNEHLPVLYLLHGANSNPAEIMERSEVVKLSTMHRLITVIPDADFSYYTNAKHKRHAQWEEVIAQDLPRDVETPFQTLPGREHTGVAGISMGGYGAAKLALKHPESYAFVGIMSGALDITRREASLQRWGQTWRIWTIFGIRPSARRDEDVFDMVDRRPQNHNITWFESCGKDDPLLGTNERFAHRLRSRGANVHVLTTPGGHDWNSWNAAMSELFVGADNSLR